MTSIYPQQLSNAHEIGRQYLYDLYCRRDENKKEALIDVIDQFRDSIDEMSKALGAGARYSYNFTVHEFYVDDKRMGEDRDVGMMMRDFLVDRIRKLAGQMLAISPLPGDQKEQCVEQFLMAKLLAPTPFTSAEDFISRASDEEQNQGKDCLVSCLKKLQRGKFLSCEEKLSKKQAPHVLLSSPDPLCPDEESLPQESLCSDREHLFSCVSCLLVRAKDHQVYSQSGCDLKKELLEELKQLKKLFSDDNHGQHVKLHALFSKDIQNRFSDDICLDVEMLRELLLKQQVTDLLSIGEPQVVNFSQQEKKMPASSKQPSSSWIKRTAAAIRRFFARVKRWFVFLFTTLFSR